MELWSTIIIWITLVAHTQGQDTILYSTSERPLQSVASLSLVYGHPEDWGSDPDDKSYNFDLNLNHLRPGLIVADYNNPGSIFTQDRDDGRIYEVEGVDKSSLKISDGFYLSTTEMKGLSLDWVSQNIYFTDKQLIGLWSYKNRRYQVVLNNVGTPYGIDVDPEKGLLFWTDYRSGEIQKSSLSGSSMSTIIDGQTRPSLVTLDTKGQMLYWVSGDTTRIQSANYQGSNRLIIVSEPLYKLVAMEFYDSYILVQHEDTSDIYLHHDNGTFSQRVFYNVSTEFTQHGMAISASDAQPRISSMCSTDNGGCAHICVHDPVGPQCMCQFGYQKDPNNQKRCTIEYTYEDIVIVGDFLTDKIYQIDLDTQEVREILGVNSPFGLTYDPLDKVIYFTHQDESDNYFIKSFNLETMNSETVLSVSGNTESVAIDPVHKKLYYGNGGLNQISVVELLTGNDKVLIDLSSRETALGITLDITNGYIYWARYGTFGSSIDRADLYTGRNIKQLASSNVEKPFGLALDLPAKMIYWCDVDRETVERMTLDGLSRTVIKRNVICWDVAVDATYVYCTEKYDIVRINKQSMTQDYLGPRFYGRASGMTSFVPDYQPVGQHRTSGAGTPSGVDFAVQMLLSLLTLKVVRDS